MTFNIKQPVTDERVWDLLVTATEGGSNYWYVITKHNRKEVGAEYIHEAPLKEGGYMVVKDQYGDFPAKKITRKELELGLDIFAKKHPRHFANWVNENDDAETGDVFLQCVCFGDVVYG